MQPSNSAVTFVDRVARVLVGVVFAAAFGVIVTAAPGGPAAGAAAMVKAVEPIATFCFNLG